MRLIRIRDQKVIADSVKIADSFITRLAGLTGKKTVPDGFALILEPCRAIHTCLMRTPIDVVFMDGQGTAVRLIPEMRPYRFSGIINNARKVAELSPGAISRNGILVSDVFKLMED